MNKRDIVLEAVAHKNTGRVPYCIRLTQEALSAYGEQILKDYPDPKVAEAYREGLITLEDAVGLSFGNYMMGAPLPWWSWDYAHMPAAYHDPDEVPEEMPPTIDDRECESKFRKAAFLRREFGVYAAALIWGSHWEKAYFTRGIENMLADFAGAPEFVRELLDFIIRKNMEYLPGIVNCPDYDGILLGSDWGTQNDLIFSPSCWRTMIQPGEKVQYEMIHAAGKQVMVHSCGCILKIMPELVELGVDILNPVQPECMDLRFLKETYGDRITFWGGISTQQTLPYGTPEEVRKESARVIELLSRDGGYITCSSQEIQTDVPYENLRALVDTARDYAGEAYR